MSMNFVKYNMLRACILCIGISIIVFVFASCQPTPDSESVVSKDTDLVDTVLEAAEDEEQLEITNDTIFDQIEELSGHVDMEFEPNEQVKIFVDADVAIPEYDKFPVMRIEQKNFTMEQFKKLY